MNGDTAIIHFGEFFRRRVVERGRIQDVFAEAGLNSATGYRFFRSPDPEPLRIAAYNKQAAAKAAGYSTWDELDAAWKVTPVVPVERRSGGIPPYAKHLAETGQLRILNATPTAVIEVLKRLSHEGLVEVAKALPAEVIEEVAGAGEKRSADSRNLKPRGVLLNYQLGALAEAPDMQTFERMVKEIRKQQKGWAKK